MTEWKQATEATMNKAKGMYLALLSMAETPQEAAQIIIAVYVNLWVQCAVGHDEMNLDAALKEFNDSVRTNVAMAQQGEGTLQ